MMWYWGSGAHWWGWLIGVAAMVAFWGLILWAVWYVVTTVSGRPEPPRPDEAKRILDERLARGEITTEEYAQLREVIRSDGTRATAGDVPARTGGRQ
jgi:putative membrane protein